MRYQALEVYSGILRAVGWFIIIATVLAMGLFIGGTAMVGGPLLGSVAVVAAIGVGVGGAVGGLVLIAVGQLLCVFIDIEANTRTMIHREWDLDR